MTMHLCYLLILCLHLCYFAVQCDVCLIKLTGAPVINGSDADNDPGFSDQLITCPRPDDPPEWTSCCNFTIVSNGTNQGPGASVWNTDAVTCCSPDQEPILFYFISDQLALFIAATITVLLLIITVIIVICCFWSRCPLYMMCRVRYHQDDVIAYASKEDEKTNLNDMPPEEQKGVTVYSPNAVKVTLKNDV